MACPDENELTTYLAGGLSPEIEHHIDGCTACQDLLALYGKMSIAGADETGEVGPGRAIGRYVVTDRIGEGAMGAVYAAYDPELDRKVAVKLLHDGGDAANDLRLIREARALARLSHPNVVAVHDVATIGGRVVIVMELVDGVTLAEWLRTPRSWREIVRALADAGRGLAAAHRAGLVHRDFKPANVMVRRDGRICVLDFGLARAALAVGSGELVEADAAISRSGAVAGTPAYMAPEQLAGAPADAATDQFAFCIALYEALHGRHAFGERLDAILRAAKSGALRPPVRRVPARITRAIARGLSVDRAARWPSLDALVAVLERDPTRRRLLVAAGAALAASGAAVAVVATRHDSPVCQGAERKLAGTWDGERRAAVQHAFAATGAAYAGEAWTAVARALDAYTDRWVALHTSACEATRVRGEQSEQMLDLQVACLEDRRVQVAAVTQILASATPESIAHGVETVEAIPGVDACSNPTWLRSRVEPPRDLAQAAWIDEVRREIARATAVFNSGDYKAGLAAAEHALAAALPTHYPPVIARAYMQRADVDERSSKLEAALADTHEAIVAAEAGGDDATAALGWSRLALYEGAAGHFDVANDAVKHAQAIIQRWPGDAEIEGPVGYAHALLLLDQHDLAGAERQARDTIAVWRRHPHAPGPLGHALDLLAAILREQGKLDEGLAVARESLALKEAAFGAHHPDIGVTLDELSQLYSDLYRFEEARAATERCIAIRTAALPPDHPELASTIANLAITLSDLGKYEESLAQHERALAILRKKLGPEHPNIANSLMNMSASLVALGRIDEGIRDAREAIAIFEHAFGKDADQIAYAALALAKALRAKHATREALANEQRALAIAEATGDGHPVLVGLLIDLGDTYLELHDAAHALAAVQRAVAVAERTEAPPRDLADARFALARALWDAGQRAPAREQADAARALYATAHAPAKDLDAWTSVRGIGSKGKG